jgi:hypothetical protein
MSHNDEAGGRPLRCSQSASAPGNLKKRWDAMLDALHGHHRAVGVVVAATAALSLNGALLSAFDTVAKRGLASEVAGQQPTPANLTAQQESAIQPVAAAGVRRIELPPVQIVGRRLEQATPITAQAYRPEAAAESTAPWPVAAASALGAFPVSAAAPLSVEVTASNRLAGR